MEWPPVQKKRIIVRLCILLNLQILIIFRIDQFRKNYPEFFYYSLVIYN